MDLDAPKIVTVGTRYKVKQSKRTYEVVWIEPVYLGNNPRIYNYLYHCKSDQTGKVKLHNNYWMKESIESKTFTIIN